MLETTPLNDCFYCDYRFEVYVADENLGLSCF